VTLGGERERENGEKRVKVKEQQEGEREEGREPGGK
jgi:hypothetical protein